MSHNVWLHAIICYYNRYYIEITGLAVGLGSLHVAGTHGQLRTGHGWSQELAEPLWLHGAVDAAQDELQAREAHGSAEESPTTPMFTEIHQYNSIIYTILCLIFCLILCLFVSSSCAMHFTFHVDLMR